MPSAAGRPEVSLTGRRYAVRRTAHILAPLSSDDVYASERDRTAATAIAPVTAAAAPPMASFRGALGYLRVTYHRPARQTIIPKSLYPMSGHYPARAGLSRRARA